MNTNTPNCNNIVIKKRRQYNYKKFTISRYSNIHVWKDTDESYSGYIEELLDLYDDLRDGLFAIRTHMVRNKEIQEKLEGIIEKEMYDNLEIKYITEEEHDDICIEAVAVRNEFMRVYAIYSHDNDVDDLDVVNRIHCDNFVGNPRRYLKKMEREIERARQHCIHMVKRYKVLTGFFNRHYGYTEDDVQFEPFEVMSVSGMEY